MKNFLIKCLIVSGILFGTGIVLCGACMALGGNKVFAEAKEDMNYGKMSEIIDKFAKNSNIKFNVTGNTVTTSSGNFVANEPIYDGDHKNDTVAKASEISSIVFDLGGGTCDIKESNDEYVHIYFTGKGHIQYFVNNKTLHVNGFLKNNENITISKNNLEVFLPKNLSLSSFHLELGAGEIAAKHIKADSINLDLGAGEIEMDDIISDSLTCNIGAGGITMEDSKSGTMDIILGMGSFEYDGSIKGNVNLDCGMGSADFSLDGSESDYNYNLDCSMGNIDLDSFSMSGMSSSKNINNNADYTFDISCSMGNVSISF